MYELTIFVVLLSVGYVFGQLAEKRHFKSIIQREEQLRHVLAFSTRFPPPQDTPTQVALVAGNVVVSVDYFKRIVAGLRMMVGGRMRVYETLVERARREAILRMKEDALRKGAHQICNVKLETASISKGARQQIGSVEVYAYGTALIKSGRPDGIRKSPDP